MTSTVIHGDQSGIYAKVVRDSTTVNGKRLTTMEVQCHRFVLSEFNTHRAFSRNSASSRAIPVAKQIEKVRTNPALPLSWPAEKKGMQGGEELDEAQRAESKYTWLGARNYAVSAVELLVQQGLHKSVTNRLLEPFMWHKIIVSATEWENFFELRCSPLAQPEIRALAIQMREALDHSTPRSVSPDHSGYWHLPYTTNQDMSEVNGDLSELCKISVARCARVSYLTHDGKRDLQSEFDLFDSLKRDGHWSPFEHVATPDSGLGAFTGKSNFNGWLQLRHLIGG